MKNDPPLPDHDDPALAHITPNLRPLAVHIDTPHTDPANARTGHDLDGIAAAIKQYGQRTPIVINVDEGDKIMKGNGTHTAMKRAGYQWIAAVQVHDDPTTATGYAIADNRAGDKSHFDDMALARLLQSLPPEVETGFDDEAMATVLAEARRVEEYDTGVNGDEKPNPRNLPIDVIYTLQMADCTCCLAVQAGLKYGIQSANYRLCPYVGKLSGRHEVVFIDNDYFDYKHDVHLSAVREIKPKYCTVMDVMTSEQCKKDGIEHHELSQILDWAEELSEHAENVIVIPKYDCLDQIPEKFMLGFSVPTSHGGTPLPVEMFRGRRVHLLGGSWKKQLAYMAVLGDDVVSLDNNAVQNQARRFGSFVFPNGESGQISADLGLTDLVNVRYAALAISFGNMAAMINQLYTAVEEPA